NGALRFRPEGAKEPAPATTSSGQAAASGAPDQNRGRAQLAQRGAPGAAGAAGSLGRGWRRGGGQQEKKQQTVYILDANKKPQAGQIRTGNTDGPAPGVVAAGP